uniref:Cadherin-4 (inferred by orthology to a C. elegans protein) n=1 Tax=Anisakis simplex TaxID=6269 RepID=A0A0M3KDY6_ANISI
LETTTSVILTITDQNDARPIFEQDHYHAQITDQLPAFSDVVQVEASDADIGLNGQIYYSLLNQSADFMIDPLTGWIRTLKSVDAGTYHLRLLAEDRQSRLFYRQGSDDEEQERFPAAIVLNEAKVVSSTIKVNESKALMPQIVFERKPIRSGSMNDSQLVAIIRVSDVQESDEVMVALLNSDYSHAFRIDKEVIGGAWRLDTISGYRLPTNLTLSLIAKVIGSPQRNCTAEIEVEFDEKRSVRFSNVDGTLHLNVNESVPIGFVLITVQAYVTNGFVEDSRRLSYEAKIRLQLPEYKAGAYVQVEVSVVDSNDHSPVFAAKWARGEPIAISKDFPLEETIVRVDALDSDTGHNGEVHYMLVNDEETPFRVDHKTGDVKLRRAPHANESSWRLRIRAIDGGWPYPRSSQMILTIFLNHTKIPTKTRFGLSRDPPNFNPPKFEILSQTLRISEDAPIGQVSTSV